MVLSAEPEPNLSLFNKHSALTPLEWPFKMYKQFPFLSKIFIDLSSLQTTNFSSFNSIISFIWSLNAFSTFVVSFNYFLLKYA